MNKVICDICGTSYPDTAIQCPICGWAHSDKEQAAPSDVTEHTEARAYVKGGRYSKANVRKANAGGAVSVNVVREKRKKKTAKRPENFGLKITALALVFAIICVAIYIVIVYTRDTSNPVQSPTNVVVYEEVQAVEGEEQAKSEDESADLDQTSDAASADQEQSRTAATPDFSFTKTTVELKNKDASETIKIETNAESLDGCTVVVKNSNVVKAQLNGNTVVVTAITDGTTEIELVYDNNVVATCNVTCQFEKVSTTTTNTVQSSDTSTGDAELDQSVDAGTGNVVADG